MYVCIYIYTHYVGYVCVYIYRERDIDRESEIDIYIFI